MWELVPSFYHVCSTNQTQVASLMGGPLGGPGFWAAMVANKFHSLKPKNFNSPTVLWQFKNKDNKILMCKSLPTCMYMYHVYA